MKIPYKIYSPGGNLTALIHTQRDLDYLLIAKRIMTIEPKIEQVGFVLPSKNEVCDFHLEMMGGEFCGNAARCAVLSWGEINKKNNVIFTVSGFSVPLTAHIQDKIVTLRIPGEFLQSVKKVKNGWLVDFYGISFLVTENKMTKQEIENFILKNAKLIPAMGVVFFKTSLNGYNIDPWIWVGSTKTLIQETACASGSIATAMVLKERGLKASTYNIIQPSDSLLSISIEPEFLDITISGIVEFMSKDFLNL